MKHRLFFLTMTISVLLCCINIQAQQYVQKASPDSLNTTTIGERNSVFCDAKTAKIVVTQSYESAEKVSLPVKEIITRLLQYAGIKSETINYDIVVSIDVLGGPIGKQYTGTISGLQYSGASIKGTVIFETTKGEKYREEFNGVLSPPAIITNKFYTPDDAPFMEAFRNALPSIMISSFYKIFGLTPLTYALKDELEDVRVAAVIALEIINDKRTVELLIDALKDQDSDVRQAAALALGNIKDSRAIEPLIAVLPDQNSDVGNAAAFALGKIKDDRALEPLIVAQTYLFVEEIAKGALNKINPNWRNTEAAKNAVPMLITALKNNDSRVRNAAAVVLANIKDKRAVEPLIEALTDDRGMTSNTYMVEWALNEIDPNWEKTEAARNAVPGLIIALKNPYLTQSVAKTLGRINDTTAVEPLISKLKVLTHSYAKIEIVYALGKLNDNRAIEALVSEIKNKDKFVRYAIVYTLGDFKDSRSVEPLINALLDDNDDVRKAAVEALDKIDPNWRNIQPAKNIVPELIVSLKENHGGPALFALIMLKNNSSIEPLIECLNDKDNRVRGAAQHALIEITGKNFGEDYKKWQKWWMKQK